MYVDASNFAIGSVLSQKELKGHDCPTYFSNKQLSGTEKNYCVTEREGLVILHSIYKYRHYLLGYKFTFHVDHDALNYMVNKPQLSGRIARWILLLQDFDFAVSVRLGKKHANADFLSQISEEVNTDSIDDSFLDAHIFQVDIILVEHADIIHYLHTNPFPKDYTDKQK